MNKPSIHYLPTTETTATTATTPAAPQINSAMSAMTQPTSPILRLPAELRNKIYTFIGISTSVAFFKLQGYSKHPFTHTIPPFLRTCKQICSEATALVYANATFNMTRRNDFAWIACCAGAKSCTTLKVSWVVAMQIAGYIDADRGSFAVCPLQKLERVEVMCASKKGSERIKVALRNWFGKEDLVVKFRDLGGVLMAW